MQGDEMDAKMHPDHNFQNMVRLAGDVVSMPGGYSAPQSDDNAKAAVSYATGKDSAPNVSPMKIGQTISWWSKNKTRQRYDK